MDGVLMLAVSREPEYDRGLPSSAFVKPFHAKDVD